MEKVSKWLNTCICINTWNIETNSVSFKKMYIYPDKNLLKDQGSIFFKEKYVFLFVITFCWKSRIFENEYTYEVYIWPLTQKIFNCCYAERDLHGVSSWCFKSGCKCEWKRWKVIMKADCVSNRISTWYAQRGRIYWEINTHHV